MRGQVIDQIGALGTIALIEDSLVVLGRSGGVGAFVGDPAGEVYKFRPLRDCFAKYRDSGQNRNEFILYRAAADRPPVCISRFDDHAGKTYELLRLKEVDF